MKIPTIPAPPLGPDWHERTAPIRAALEGNRTTEAETLIAQLEAYLATDAAPACEACDESMLDGHGWTMTRGTGDSDAL